MAQVLAGSPGLLINIAECCVFRELADLRGACRLNRTTIDQAFATPETLRTILKVISNGASEDWEPPSFLECVYNGDDDHDALRWYCTLQDIVEPLLEDIIPEGALLMRLRADTLSRILMFRRRVARYELRSTVVSMPVLKTTNEVNGFWGELRTEAPAILLQDLAAAQWLMRLLVAAYNFVHLRVRISRWSDDDDNDPVFEIAQLFFEDKVDTA